MSDYHRSYRFRTQHKDLPVHWLVNYNDVSDRITFGPYRRVFDAFWPEDGADPIPLTNVIDDLCLELLHRLEYSPFDPRRRL